MITPIGRGFDSRTKRILGLLVGCGATLADMVLVREGRSELLSWRLAPPLIAFGLFRLLLHGDCPSLGLRLNPIQGWLYWIRPTCWIAVAMGALLLSLLGLAMLLGLDLPPPRRLAPSQFVSVFLFSCYMAPIVEETTYRLVLCAPLAAWPGPAASIVVSGVVFALLHVFYGNPAPTNAIAGFVLGWAYLKSGSILLPIALHSLGNLFVVLLQLGTWYAVSPAAS